MCGTLKINRISGGLLLIITDLGKVSIRVLYIYTYRAALRGCILPVCGGVTVTGAKLRMARTQLADSGEKAKESQAKASRI
jgi:hypothetical protein